MLQLVVAGPDAIEDEVGSDLLLLAAGGLDELEAQRRFVADGDLGELEALPVADAGGGPDGDGHHGRPRLQCQAPDPGAGLRSHLSVAAAAALAVHPNGSAALQDPKGA